MYSLKFKMILPGRYRVYRTEFSSYGDAEGTTREVGTVHKVSSFGYPAWNARDLNGEKVASRQPSRNAAASYLK